MNSTLPAGSAARPYRVVLSSLILTVVATACGSPTETGAPDGAGDEGPEWSDVYPDLAEARLENAPAAGFEARWSALQGSGALWDAIYARHGGASPEEVLAIALGLEDGAGAATDCDPETDWGRFIGEPEFEAPGDDGELTTLKQDFVFNDSRVGGLRTAPSPSAADRWSWNGASIPPMLRWAAGQPRDGCYAHASIHHDYYYQSLKAGKPSRREADRIFYRGMRANGVGKWKARSFYWAVWSFGWRAYQSPTGSVEVSAYQASDEEFLDDWLEVCTLCYLDALEHPEDDGMGLSLDDLEAWTADEIVPGFGLMGRR